MWRVDRTLLGLQRSAFRPRGGVIPCLRRSAATAQAYRRSYSSGNLWDDIHVEQLQQQQKQRPFPQDPLWGAEYSTPGATEIESRGEHWSNEGSVAGHYAVHHGYEAPSQFRSPSPPPAGQVSLTGFVERVVFHNPSTKYLVLRIHGTDGSFFSAAGLSPQVPQVGASVQVNGSWVSHPRFGQQFDMSSIQMSAADSQVAISSSPSDNDSSPPSGESVVIPPNQLTDSASGFITRVAFQVPGGGWTALRLVYEGHPFMAVGNLYRSGLEPGQPLRFWGRWESHPKYGTQFTFDRCVPAPELGSAEGHQLEHQGQSSSRAYNEVFRGEVTRVVFQNPQTGFTVLKAMEASSSEEVAVVGHFNHPPAHMEPVQLRGRWVDHPRFGRQFQLPRPLSPQQPSLHGTDQVDSWTGSGGFDPNTDSAGMSGGGVSPSPGTWNLGSPRSSLDGTPVRVLGSIVEIKHYSPATSWCILHVQPLEAEGAEAEFHYQEDLVAVSCFLISPPVIGTVLDLEGVWQDHETFGPQIKVRRCAPLPPVGKEAIREYLLRAHLPSLGPELIYRVVEKFGDETLAVLESEPERLGDVEGIDGSSLEVICDAIAAHKQQRDLTLFFQACQIPSFLADRIQAEYGLQSAEEVVRRDPYMLIQAIPGLSFGIADRIAKALELPDSSPERIRAGLVQVLEMQANNGHCYAHQSLVLSRATQKLATRTFMPTRDMLLEHLQALNESGTLVRVDHTGESTDASILWYTKDLYQTERSLAARIRSYLGLPSLIAEDGTEFIPDAPEESSASEAEQEDPPAASTTPPPATTIQRKAAEDWLTRYCEENSYELSETQKQAVLMALSPPEVAQGVPSRLAVVTGGPGTGKTFCVKVLADACAHFGLVPSFMSPTGRGASRLKEVTGRMCSTIHRALLATESGVEVIRRIASDIIIVDEASMVDIFMADAITRAMRPHARLVLIGDSEQLPSVGPGHLLSDLLQNPQLPFVALDTIYRQTEGSGIISNAHHIRRGQIPILQTVSVEDIMSDSPLPVPHGDPSQPPVDCFFFDSTQLGPEASLDYVMGPLLAKLGASDTDDVQVLTPMSKGEYGSRALNSHLKKFMRSRRAAAQALLDTEQAREQAHSLESTSEWMENSELKPLTVGGFSVGDRVIQGHNNYEKMVFNGEIGTVCDIEPTAADHDGFDHPAQSSNIYVKYRHRATPVVYDSSLDARELYPAWAITIHKSQGSEYDVAVICIHDRHSFMLSRQLVYTAITRARRFAIFLGNKNALDQAVRLYNPEKHRRLTQLAALVNSKRGLLPS